MNSTYNLKLNVMLLKPAEGVFIGKTHYRPGREETDQMDRHSTCPCFAAGGYESAGYH